MSLTFNTETFNQDVQLSTDSIRYSGPNQALDAKDEVTLKRIRPSSTSDPKQKAQTLFKMVVSGTDGTDPVGEAYCEIATRIPQGMQASEITTLKTRLRAFIDTAHWDDLVDKLDIAQ
jgi:hypothetical protein